MRDINTLLHDANPSPDTPGYSEIERARILKSATSAPENTGRKTAWRIGAVAAAALLVTGIAASNLGGTTPTAAAEVLDQAAINAVDPEATADQWWQITTTSTYQIDVDGGNCEISSERVEWVAVDGNRPTVTQETLLDIRPVAEGAQCDASVFPSDSSARTSNLTPSDIPASWQAPTPEFIASLPRDVDALRDRIYADSEGQGRDPESEIHVFVADILRSGLVPADLRSSLFTVLKSVPGLEVTSETVVDVHGNTEQLLIDPANGMVVGEEDVFADGAPGHGTTVERELVDAVPADVMAAAVVAQCEVNDDGSVSCVNE